MSSRIERIMQMVKNGEEMPTNDGFINESTITNLATLSPSCCCNVQDKNESVSRDLSFMEIMEHTELEDEQVLAEYSDDSIADPHFEPKNSAQEDESSESEASPQSPTTGIPNNERGNMEEATNVSGHRSSRKRCDRNKKRELKGETRAVRKERKTMRNTGREYVTQKQKKIPERKMQALKPCRNKCEQKVTNDERQNIFIDYWALGDYNRRVAYIAGLLEIKDKQSSRPRAKNPEKRRNRVRTIQYHLQIRGSNVSVCKSCFLATFDETPKFVANVVKKKLVKDSGGKGVPSNKRSEHNIQNVRNHILSIPTYESHYTRRDSEKRYLPSHVTLTNLFREYKAKYPENHVSRFIYEREFHSMNIKIKQPHKDTCQTCDRLDLQIKSCSGNNTELKAQLQKHHEEADLAYSAKAKDKEISKNDPSKKTITFDMQQCLPTPQVHSSLAFYKRQLWTYNMTIHDCDTSQGYCYMWHEGMAKRGGDDIASCVFKHLMYDIDKTVKWITMYSDTCGGQNKNSFFAAMCMVALHESEHLERLDHKFLIPGHTHMECDTDHSIIEKKKKKVAFAIEHPHDWVQLVRMASTTKPFVVREMNREDFLKFSSLLKGPLVNRKLDSDRNGDNWRHVKWLRYEKSKPGILQYKTSLKELDEFKEVNFMRRKNSKIAVPDLSYEGPVPISSLKKKDLIDLLPYISQSLWDFYKNLKESGEAKDTFPDQSSDEDDE